MSTRQELIERVEARRVLSERLAEPMASKVLECLEKWVADVENDKLCAAAIAAVGDMPDIGGTAHPYLTKFAKVAGDLSMVLPTHKAAEVCSYLILLEQFDRT